MEAYPSSSESWQQNVKFSTSRHEGLSLSAVHSRALRPVGQKKLRWSVHSLTELQGFSVATPHNAKV